MRLRVVSPVNSKLRSSAGRPANISLDQHAEARFTALKAWRAEIAREHNVPAYVVFQNVTLAEMAQIAPTTLGELAQISGVGSKKLEAYGHAILQVLAGD